jgi:hypothetical protein
VAIAPVGVVKSVLFEHHHLYYLPQFIPIIKELQRRGKYRLAASISTRVDPREIEVFYRAVGDLKLEGIQKCKEWQRRNALRERAFDIIIVGNKGHVTAIAGPHSLVVMVYHGRSETVVLSGSLPPNRSASD